MEWSRGLGESYCERDSIRSQTGLSECLGGGKTMQVEIMNDVLTKVGQEEEIQYIFYLTFKKIYQSIWHILFHIYMYMYIYELVISVCVCVCVWSYCSIK